MTIDTQLAPILHEPWTMQRMIDALATAGRVLRLGDRHPGLAVAATKKIIELTEAGEHEAERLTAAAARGSLAP
jgi:hypothetical protein